MDDPAKPILDAIELRRAKIQALWERQTRDANRLPDIRLRQLAFESGPADPLEEEASAAEEAFEARAATLINGEPAPNDGGLSASMIEAWNRMDGPCGDEHHWDANSAASLLLKLIASAPVKTRIAIWRALLGCQYPE